MPQNIKIFLNEHPTTNLSIFLTFQSKKSDQRRYNIVKMSDQILTGLSKLEV